MTLSDLERRDTMRQIFLADLRNYARTVLPRTSTFGKVTPVGERRISIWGQPLPHLNGRGHSVPIISGTLYLRPHHLTLTDRGVFQQGQARSLPKGSGVPFSPKIFGTSYTRPHGMTHSNQILHSDQTRWRENLHRLDHAPASANFCDTNANARSVCGS